MQVVPGPLQLQVYLRKAHTARYHGSQRSGSISTALKTIHSGAHHNRMESIAQKETDPNSRYSFHGDYITSKLSAGNQGHIRPHPASGQRLPTVPASDSPQSQPATPHSPSQRLPTVTASNSPQSQPAASHSHSQQLPTVPASDSPQSATSDSPQSQPATPHSPSQRLPTVTASGSPQSSPSGQRLPTVPASGSPQSQPAALPTVTASDSPQYS